METKPGVETSEFKLARLVIIAGLSLDVVAMVMEGMKNMGLNFGWMPLVLTVLGTLTALVKGLGYTRSRTMLKLSTLSGQVTKEVGADLSPLLKQLLPVLTKELLPELKAQLNGQPMLPAEQPKP